MRYVIGIAVILQVVIPLGYLSRIGILLRILRSFSLTQFKLELLLLLFL